MKLMQLSVHLCGVQAGPVDDELGVEAIPPCPPSLCAPPAPPAELSCP
jgi:hypothetical protein